MTVSYTSTQNPQEPEPQHPDAARPEDSTRLPQRMGMPRPPLPEAVQPANDQNGVKQARRVQNAPLRLPATNGHNGHNVGTISEASEARFNAFAPKAPNTHNQDGSINYSQTVQQKPEIENGNIILYRHPNFFLRTAYRPGQKANPLRRPTGHTTVMPKVMPHQEKRIAASETHMMPSVSLNNTAKTSAIPLPAWLEAIFVVLGLLGTLVAHAYNMFNFPRYELDEGTYISNAWGITQGLISPYPYGYGHPPLAWIQIAAWIQFTGGFFTFGNALNSGRVFMLFYAVGSALLVYLIVRCMGGSRSAGLLALVIFSLSPLSITYQRQIFLDNVATFWLLLSLYWLVVSKSRLLYIVGAALAFGAAVLSKEVYLICLPVMIYAAWLHTTKFQRKFGLVAFIYAVIGLCSTFALMAVLKDELFPYAWHLPWDTHPHLSMLDTLIGQAQRGQTGGSFLQSWYIWLDNDIVFIALSLAAPLFNLVYGWWNRKHLLLALLALSFWLLLVRGGLVLSFYIIPLIPIVALNSAMALNVILSWLGKLVRFDVIRTALLLIALAAIVPYDINATSFRFYQHPTSTQEDAMVWVRNHVPHNAFIVINSYLYLDLRLPGGQGVGDGATFPHAEVYWNVAFDPELHDQALEDNWDRIDYIVADSEMLNDINTYGGPMNLIKTAKEHSILRADFRTDDHNLQIVVQVYQVIHKNAQPTVYSAPDTRASGYSAESNMRTSFNGMSIGKPMILADRQRKILS